jgi:archaellum component FlaC
MSDESLLLVRSLKDRVGRLFGEFVKVEQKNATLIEEIAGMQNRIKDVRKQLDEITNKYENLKLAKGFESGLAITGWCGRRLTN